MKNQFCFYINGQKHAPASSQAHLMLSDYLRYEISLTGTKVVCAEGDCGACSVLRYNPIQKDKGIDGDNFLPINSCIVPISLLHGSHIITVEGLSDNNRLHEAQRSMVDCHGSQCGFCTPGFVMALAGLCEEKLSKGDTSINENEAKNAMTGNLCRCTGYESIVKAGCSINLSKEASLKKRYHTKKIEKELTDLSSKSLYLETDSYSFYAPATYREALEYLNDHPETRMIANGTDLGVVHNKRKVKLAKLMSLHLINEAYKITQEDETIRVGSRVTLTEFRHFLKDKCNEYAQYLDIFASPQIKNNATLIGNIANASPIGDNAPVLLALDADITLESLKGSRTIKLNDFFLDYRKTDLKKGELITGVSFKLTQNNFKLFKNSIRKDLDISTVNMAFNLKTAGDKIEEILIGAGGIAATPLRLIKTESFLKGKTLDEKTTHKACEIAQSEFTPLSDLRASAAYRRVLVSNYIKRFLSEVRP